MTDNLLGCTQGGYFGDTGSWAYTISQFNATNDWTRVFLYSDQVIPMFYSNYTELKQITEDPVPLAIAEILKVTLMHRVADTYGPIPYTRIGADGQISVPYDDQQTVYETMINDLTAAVATLTEHRSSNLNATADYVYGGKVDKWIKFGNSLKLRLAMRIVNVDREFARTAAESAVNHELGVFEDNSDNARYSSYGTSGNPIYAAARYNTPQGCATGGDSSPTEWWIPVAGLAGCLILRRNIRTTPNTCRRPFPCSTVPTIWERISGGPGRNDNGQILWE